MPTPDTIQDLLKQAAFHHLIHKLLAGIPEGDKEFWNNMLMEDLHEVYVALSDVGPLKLFADDQRAYVL